MPYPFDAAGSSYSNMKKYSELIICQSCEDEG